MRDDFKIDFLISLAISFSSLIVAGIANIIISWLNKKIGVFDKAYYLKRYDFYKNLYLKYCVKNSNWKIISIDLNNDFNSLYDNLSNDLIYIGPKLRNYFLMNKKCISKETEKMNPINFIYKNKFLHGWYVSTIISEIYKEYNYCCNILGYRTYKGYYYIANSSLFISILTITFLYSVPNLHGIITDTQYIYSIIISIILFIISITTFILNKDYFARY